MNLKEEFEYFLENCTKSPNSFSNYHGGLKTFVSERLKALVPNFTDIYDYDDPNVVEGFANLLENDSVFTGRDRAQRGGRMYSNSISSYLMFLKARKYFSTPREKDVPEADKKYGDCQQIYYGAPGTGKSYRVKQLTQGEDVVRTTFHPDSDYSTFVGAYKPTMQGEKIVYEFVAQAFLQAYVTAWEHYAEASDGSPKKQFLVIEEINRGNCAQIFGDLFQLLDRNKYGFSDYYVHADKDMKAYLAKEFSELQIAQKTIIDEVCGEKVVDRVLSGEILLLPNNLYIWATMNTSDQSLFPIDSAFKRRWEWIYVPIANVKAENWKIAVGADGYDWWDFVKKINKHIYDTTNSADKQLGYFFCKSNNKVVVADTFVNKVVFYLWNDVFKDYGFDDSIFNDYDDRGKLTFDKFYTIGHNGEPVVVSSKVAMFLNNLGVSKADDISSPNEEETIEDEDDWEEQASGNRRKTRIRDGFPTYSINGGDEMGANETMRSAVETYSRNHPEMRAKDVVDAWKALNIKLGSTFPFIQTQDELDTLSQRIRDAKKRVKLVNVNGESVYITTQVTNNDLPGFIEKVNEQNWGITIAKVR